MIRLTFSEKMRRLFCQWPRKSRTVVLVVLAYYILLNYGWIYLFKTRSAIYRQVKSACYETKDAFTCKEIMTNYFTAEATQHQPRSDFYDRCAYRSDDGEIIATPKSVWRIPKIVHFIFIPGNAFSTQKYSPRLNKSSKYQSEMKAFNLINFLALKSASQIIRPQKIIIHISMEPEDSKYWRWAKALPNLEMNFVTPPSSIFGNPVTKAAHQADIIRLQVLRQYGGIYLDIDVIQIKSLDPLLHNEAVMSHQDVNYGLCNAFMMFAENSTFLNSLYESYRTFDGSNWDYHSVKQPLAFSRNQEKYGSVCTLHRLAYFYPSYFVNHVNFVQTEDIYPFQNAVQYGYHYWAHSALEFGVGNWNASDIQVGGSSFKRLLILYLDENNNI